MEDKVQTYTITLTTNKDGRTTLNRVNNGFNPMELLGILHVSQEDILVQVRIGIKPIINKTIREVIVTKVPRVLKKTNIKSK